MTEALSLKHGEGAQPFFYLGLHGRSHTKAGVRELNLEVSVRRNDLNQLSLEAEMKV